MTHPMIVQLPVGIEDRLLVRRLVTPAGCWEWAGSRRSGYGRVWVGRKQFSVHRLAAALWIEGFDYDGPLLACHHCDNPPCFNPDHLFAGSAADNMSDASRKGRLTGRQKGPHPTKYPRVRACAACGSEYEPDANHRGRSVVCSQPCLAKLRSITALAKSAPATEKMRELIASGMTYRAVGARFGISATSVHNRVKGRPR